MKIMHALIATGMLFLLAACSGGDEESAAKAAPTGDHVFKEQQAALEKAKEAEKIIQQAAEDQAQSIEEQTQ